MEIRVDLGSAVPIYVQIVDRIRELVATQALKPGEQLPTIRQLAVELTVDPNTVARAYTLLDSEGVISTQRGRGTYVSGRQDSERLAGMRTEKLHAMLRRCVVEALSLGYAPPEVLMVFSQELNEQQRGIAGPAHPEM
jgi:GntR family transcriptional regulator